MGLICGTAPDVTGCFYWQHPWLTQISIKHSWLQWQSTAFNTTSLLLHLATADLLFLPPSARQHPSYGGDCLEVTKDYYQNSSVLDCVTQCSQSAAHLCEQFLQVQVPTDWVCHIGTLTLCIEAIAQSCITVTWWSGSGGIQAWSQRPIGFLQCFNVVVLVIWPVKIIPKMTYYVSSGTLNPIHSLTCYFKRKTMCWAFTYQKMLWTAAFFTRTWRLILHGV